MSLSNLFANRILKVNFNGEMARLPLDLSPTATCEEIFDHMRDCVQRAFNLSGEQMRGLMLKYADEEGDLCTLTARTLGDLAQLFPEGVIRISAAIDAPSAPAHNVHTMDVVDEQDKNVEVERQPPSSCETTQCPVIHPMAKLAAQFSPLWLPKVAAELQSAQKQGELDRFGKEKREELITAFKRLHDRLETVPEASYLNTKLSSYIDGSDPEHLGSFVAELLQILVASDNKAAVVGVVEDFASSMMETHLNPMMQNMFRGHDADTGNQAGASTEGTTQVPISSSVPDLAGVLGNLFAGKGLGKGVSAASGTPEGASSVPTQEAPPTGPCPVPDIAGLLGNIFAGKAGGKGAQFATTPAADDSMGAQASAASPGAFHTSAPSKIPNIAGLLGNIFAGKGLGKGVPSAWTPTDGYDMAAQPSAPPAEASVLPPMQDTAGPGHGNESPEQAARASMFEEEVKDLMDMGLVSDEQVAIDLLNAHGGELSKVVDTLTG